VGEGAQVKDGLLRSFTPTLWNGVHPAQVTPPAQGTQVVETIRGVRGPDNATAVRPAKMGGRVRLVRVTRSSTKRNYCASIPYRRVLSARKATNDPAGAASKCATRYRCLNDIASASRLSPPMRSRPAGQSQRPNLRESGTPFSRAGQQLLVQRWLDLAGARGRAPDLE